MRYHIINFEKIKRLSLVIIVLLLFIATNVKTQSVLEISSGATVNVTSGADICADSIIGNINGDGTICGNPTAVESEEESSLPDEYALAQNYPNPFNPTTTIKYSIPQSGKVTLKVYDLLGNEVATLVDEYLPAGTYEAEFSVGQDSSPDIASGIYFYKLQAESFVETKKMILMK